MGLHEVAKAMVEKPRGILAADESTGTIAKRFESVGVENTEENRRAYREMLFTTEGLGQYISGVILFSETLGQSTSDGTPFVDILKAQNIILGIKVDLGIDEQPNGEVLTKGIDDLAERCKTYVQQGAQFAKWRAVIKISDSWPTDENIQGNAELLAKYAKICQEAGLVPIVEPEVLMEGSHSLEKCKEVTANTLKSVFLALETEQVDITGMVLKPNMVVPGKDAKKAPPAEVAEATVTMFNDVLPSDLPGVAFLSGGIGDDDVTAYLNAMNKQTTPWNLSFSFGRGLQRPVLSAYAEKDIAKGQMKLLERAKASSDATVGKHP